MSTFAYTRQRTESRSSELQDSEKVLTRVSLRSDFMTLIEKGFSDFRERETDTEETKKRVFLHVFEKSTDYHDRPTLDLGSC